MDYSYFIGIDVSKLKLDVALRNSEGKLVGKPRIVPNEKEAFEFFIRELENELGKLDNALFCLEATGHYSNLVVAELLNRNLIVWVASSADIQRSIGMTRGKNDKVDACRIAEYAFRFSDKACISCLDDLKSQQLRELLTQREAYVTDRAGYLSQIKDFEGYVSDESYQTIQKLNLQIAESLTDAINELEKKIEEMILANQKLSRQYDLLQTIPGVGKVLAQTFIAVTAGFTRFNDPRAFACHAGIAPFEYVSGTSIKGRNRVSHRANKRLKSLLHMAALCCMRVKGELREYYLRKVSEGKSKMSVINALRNKIVQRIFAVIKRNSCYQNLVIS